MPQLKQRILCNASLRLLVGGGSHWYRLSRRCQRTRAPVAVNVFFPYSNAAMSAAFIDPHISNETKRQLAELIEARRWPVEYQDPKTKLIWLYRPGMSPTLEGVRSSNAEAKKLKAPDSSPRARPALSRVGFRERSELQ